MVVVELGSFKLKKKKKSGKNTFRFTFMSPETKKMTRMNRTSVLTQTDGDDVEIFDCLSFPETSDELMDEIRRPPVYSAMICISFFICGKFTHLRAT